MGFPKKAQGDGVFGVSIRTLKPINTKPRGRINNEGDEESCSTTPTSREARIPERAECPPAPRKPRPSRCNFNGVREFFNPPDLESVFIRRAEKAN